MKINQSTVAFAATRQASKVVATQVSVGEKYFSQNGEVAAEKKETAGVLAGFNEKSASLELSGNWRNMERQLEQINRQRQRQPEPVETEEDFTIKMLKRLMEALRAMREGRAPDYEKLEETSRRSAGSVNMQAGASASTSFAMAFSGVSVSGAAVPVNGGSLATVGGSGVWEETVTMSTIFSDREVTCFSTAGKVQTADGREIDFNLNLEMSREFTQVVNSTEYTRKTFCVDPLVINLEGNPASFSDKTFFFDLDADGEKEELSGLSKGSGFLALDKNGDGTINDGKELFGPQSGDGFKDLAAYDEDGNGWIDEGDSVFDRLKIWTLDENGKERLVGIGKAGVGAIYLGKADTKFSLNDMESNETQGIIRSTGIFLKENGGMGTVQHVDYVL